MAEGGGVVFLVLWAPGAALSPIASVNKAKGADREVCADALV